MHILKATFFTDMGATHTIAVVVVKTDHDGIQAYIGTSHAADAATIANEVGFPGVLEKFCTLDYIHLIP
jgi:hypothetical protein